MALVSEKKAKKAKRVEAELEEDDAVVPDKKAKKKKRQLEEEQEEQEELVVEKKVKKKKKHAEEPEPEEPEPKKRKKKKAEAEAEVEEDVVPEKKLKKQKKEKAHAEEEEVPQKKAKKKNLKVEEDDSSEEEMVIKKVAPPKVTKKVVEEDSSDDELVVTKSLAPPVVKMVVADDGKTMVKKVVEDEREEELVVKKTDAAKVEGSGTFCAFVGGLRSHVNEEQIWKDFGECGKISDVILSRWPEDGSSKGISFITFETKAALDKCLEWHDQKYEGAWIRVERKEGGPVKLKRSSGLGGQRGFKPEGCKAVAVLKLSTKATEDDLYTFFKECGVVTNVKILRHRETMEPRGTAFVDFEDTLHTDKAVQMSGKAICGQQVKVEFAAPKNDRGGGGKGGGKGDGGAPKSKPDGCLSVVIKNLSSTASEDDLWHLIRHCGSANNVSILMDKETWMSRGIAFVDFDDSADTDKAVALSGTELKGKPIRIDFKQPFA